MVGSSECVLLLLFVLLIRVVSDSSFPIGPFVGSFQGNSGKIRLHTAKDDAAVEVALRMVEQLDSTGKAVDKVTLAQSDFVWSPPTEGQINGYKAIRVFGSTSDFAGRGFLSVTAYGFRNDSQFRIGNSMVRVAKNSVKFSVKVGNWKWLDPANTLRLQFQISWKGGNPEAISDLRDEPKSTSKEKKLTFGLGDMLLATKCMVDNQEVTVIPTVSNKKMVSIPIPHFTDGADYDPTLSLSEERIRDDPIINPHNGAAKMKGHESLVLLLMMLLILLLLGVC